MADSNSSGSARNSELSVWGPIIVAPMLFLLAGVALLAVLGVAQRAGWLTQASNGAAAEGGQPIHTCPMHPQIRQPGPGDCPICGMPLVPASAAGADTDTLAIRIPTAQRRLAHITTEPARREPLTATIQTVGEIAIDESRMATIASYVDGRLERLFADYTGVDVNQGDHLAVVYSPELYTAQVEFLESRKIVNSNSTSTLPIIRETQRKLRENTQQKLIELGMQPVQIEKLETSGVAESRLTIFAPTGGTVIEKLAVEGKYVVAGEPIYRIAELSTVWLMLELYPEDAARIRFGQRVEAEMRSMPGEVFEGRVAFIDRTVDSRKRTVGVRVEFMNEERRLRPGDYATAKIFVSIGEQGEVYDVELAGRWISPMHPQIISDKPGECTICGMDLVPASRFGYSDQPVKQQPSLYVPRSALLMAGSNSVVYVETEPGRFEIRPVAIGPILRDKVVVLDGLVEGESVATAGNFLIDSQMQLAGKPSLIDPAKAIAAKRERKTPMRLSPRPAERIGGVLGEKLESLFDAYFSVQRQLVQDATPSERESRALRAAVTELIAIKELPSDARKHLEVIAVHSEHLHHRSLDEARHEAFRPISHAMLQLAAAYRGQTARRPFHHMFCPMVKGGAGDWLQNDDKLLNPYWGSKMLRCGDHVQTIGVMKPPTKADVHDHSEHNPPPSVQQP